MDYQELIEEVYQEVQEENLRGKVANYIPELATVDPHQFGIALVDLKGNVYGVGDFQMPFSIQSISKVHTLTMVFPKFDTQLWSRVNVEPSGNPFNSIAQLEYEKGIPRNPFINAGALVITDALCSKFEKPVSQISDFINELAGENCVEINQAVMKSEKNHAARNTALAYFLKSYKNFDNSIDEVLDVYFSHCAMEMNCVDLAKSFSFLANDGYSIFANKEILTESHARRVNAIMLTCGFYDEAGEFAYRVGLPGKSGVGGGVAAVMPHKFSIAVWSPELNEKGNSVKAIRALELLTNKLSFSLF
ncbi:MAG TPA: glutaminase [Algoriphagus sp.]|jgi:glutaminase|uniref:glutaminase n=2 Tax=Algoriphagus TaxID=246875 RepID=UPI000C4BC36F|nr:MULTISPECIES: glutaminase [unclassified Algoriphagus]MAL15826.1 glutaminase [Algoriphagus sp.]MAN86360.1 glutaminase [Algoriphagus sp.]HCD87754.1 glutaminase [Algoriphagus sp.]HCH42801.1 glutaminase [Algoriphagus sp.]|tara:strand:+ start:133 stop:1047 length:915 start_codon:yes stop_codon:yes gene_type:complete